MPNHKTKKQRNTSSKKDQSHNTDDQFNLKQFRLSQDFTQIAGVKRQQLTIPVRKPHRQQFVRVHPNLRFETAALTIADTRDTYLVSQNLWSALSEEIVPIALFFTMTRQASYFLWPIRLPGPDGRIDVWNQSALEIATGKAVDRWVRVVSKTDLGLYEVHLGPSSESEPEWPDLRLDEILRIAFQDRVIDSLEHPVVRRLQGQE